MLFYISLTVYAFKQVTSTTHQISLGISLGIILNLLVIFLGLVFSFVNQLDFEELNIYSKLLLLFMVVALINIFSIQLIISNHWKSSRKTIKEGMEDILDDN